MTMRKFFPLIAVGLVIVAGLVAVSSGWGHDVTGTDFAQAREDLATLDRANTGRDAVDAAVARQPLVGETMSLSTARVVRSGPKAVWLGNSADGRSVCVVTAGSLACPPVSEIHDRGLSPAITVNGTDIVVSGVASDEVRTVDVVLADGSVQTVAVASNYFSVPLTQWPQGLRWTGPAGSEQFTFPPDPTRR